MGNELWGGLSVGADANGGRGRLIANPSFWFAGQLCRCTLGDNPGNSGNAGLLFTGSGVEPNGSKSEPAGAGDTAAIDKPGLEALATIKFREL